MKSNTFFLLAVFFFIIGVYAKDVRIESLKKAQEELKQGNNIKCGTWIRCDLLDKKRAAHILERALANGEEPVVLMIDLEDCQLTAELVKLLANKNPKLTMSAELMELLSANCPEIMATTGAASRHSTV